MIQGFSDKRSIQDKRELAIQCTNRMQSVIDCTWTKTLHFKNPETIEDTLVKLKAIYNPVKHFTCQFIPGYDPMREHEVTPFSMNYREYRQRELYLLLNDIHWITQHIKMKFVYDCIMYKWLDLLILIVSKSSKILQRWALQYDLYTWHMRY